LEYFFLIFAIYWIFGFWGFYVSRKQHIRFFRVARQFYNSRIDRLQRPPFSSLVKALEEKEYTRAVLGIVSINFNMVVLQFIMGVFILAPFLAGFAGAITGMVFSFGKKETLFPYGVLNLLFGFAAFSTSGAVGLMVGIDWIFNEMEIIQALWGNVSLIVTGMAISLIFLAINGLIEAAGPIFYDIENIPSIAAVRNKEYLSLD